MISEVPGDDVIFVVSETRYAREPWAPANAKISIQGKRYVMKPRAVFIRLGRLNLRDPKDSALLNILRKPSAL